MPRERTKVRIMQERCDTGQEKERKTSADIALSKLVDVAGRAEKLVCLVSEKMNSVTRQEALSTEEIKAIPCKAEANPTYPPLFCRIIELSEAIDHSLSRVGNIMQRCEL